jgi:hypothetical protein
MAPPYVLPTHPELAAMLRGLLVPSLRALLPPPLLVVVPPVPLL